MKVVTLRRRAIDFRDYVRRRAALDDCRHEITEPCKLFDETGRLQVIYDMLDADTGPLVEALHRIRYDTSTRTGGLVTTSRIFGAKPRLERRQRSYCSSASLATESPTEHAQLEAVAEAISERYRLATPETFAAHEAVALEKVRPEWRMAGSVFTSGIINRNNPLGYHFDAGNFENVLSCMLVLRQNISGGWLAVPELDARFLFRNNALAMFDGQSLLHGVTPMEPTQPDGYRFSVVFYSLKGLWKCLTVTEELAHARNTEMNKLLAAAAGATP